MYVEDLEHLIINLQLELNLLSVQCLCVWMKVGIKFNLIYLILLVEHMGQIIYKHLELQFMLIVELEEFIFPIDSIAKNNYPHNSNFFYPFKNNNDSNV